MGYGITPNSFNWGQNGSGNGGAFALPGAMPAPMDYGSYLPMNMDGGDSYMAPAATSIPQVSTAGSMAPAYASPIGPTVPAAGGMPMNVADATKKGEGNWFDKNMGKVNDIAGIIGGFGQVWGALQANKIAKDTLAFQKSSYNTNLANQIKSYNLALEDRIRARYTQNERSTTDANTTIAANRL